MKLTFIPLTFSILIIELIQFGACKSVSNSSISYNSSISFNSTIFSNITASSGAKCSSSTDCPDGEGCYEGICYTLKRRSTTFYVSFFGGFFGADWFYLSRGRAPFIIAGLFKLSTFGATVSAFSSFGAFGSWWFVDWINILAKGFTDGYGLPLYNDGF